MLEIKKYKEDFDKLGIYDEQEQLEILNSLLQLAIITQNNYNNIYQDSDDKANSTIQQVKEESSSTMDTCIKSRPIQ